MVAFHSHSARNGIHCSYPFPNPNMVSLCGGEGTRTTWGSNVMFSRVKRLRKLMRCKIAGQADIDDSSECKCSPPITRMGLQRSEFWRRRFSAWSLLTAPERADPERSRQPITKTRLQACPESAVSERSSRLSLVRCSSSWAFLILMEPLLLAAYRREGTHLESA